MKMSKLFVQTLREFPSDAEVMSHKLLIRAGFIKKLTGGVYSYLPLMKRVLTKIENIVREEMNASGAQELLMPFVQPEELWKESGRWDVYGKELMRLKDRHNRQMCLGPTHEEVITSIARDFISSYKQLPVNLYQIQSKFRDEIRPRFGLLRGREFIMKDAYSFHSSQNDLNLEYEKMSKTYTKIFERCGLKTKPVQSDSGAIGGAVSHEFMVLVDNEVVAGENDVFYCESCDYSANSNHAVSKLTQTVTDGEFKKFEKIKTPNIKTIEDLEKFFNVPKTVCCKALVYIADKNPVIVLIRGDKAVEETKLLNALNAIEIRIASNAEIEEIMTKNNLDASVGFIGAKGISGIKIIADETVRDLKNFIMGANETDMHFVGCNWGKDVELPSLISDLRLVEKGETCVNCGKKLKITRGIEVGNIFQLGTKYSQAMNATYTDVNGTQEPFIMGCYGIGISRTAAAAVESYHDEFVIKWPVEIAPYRVVIIPVSAQDTTQMKVANELYEKFTMQNIEVVLDDRDERPGVKFKDADLIGFPYRITVGKTINNGLVEFKIRKNNEITTISPDKAVENVINAI